jgi:hypothetical protein
MKEGIDFVIIGGFWSPGARVALRIAFLGFLGALGFIPGWERLVGFTGFFGFIGVAYIIEAIYRFKNPKIASGDRHKLPRRLKPQLRPRS